MMIVKLVGNVTWIASWNNYRMVLSDLYNMACCLDELELSSDFIYNVI
jgi:hypothetical protein